MTQFANIRFAFLLPPLEQERDLQIATGIIPPKVPLPAHFTMYTTFLAPIHIEVCDSCLKTKLLFHLNILASFRRNIDITSFLGLENIISISSSILGKCKVYRLNLVFSLVILLCTSQSLLSSAFQVSDLLYALLCLLIVSWLLVLNPLPDSKLSEGRSHVRILVLRKALNKFWL